MLPTRAQARFTGCFPSSEFKNIDAYAIATQAFNVCCSRASPNPKVDASQTTRVSKFWSKGYFVLFCVISETYFLVLLNVMSCSCALTI